MNAEFGRKDRYPSQERKSQTISRRKSYLAYSPDGTMIFRPALFLLLLVIVLVASPSTSARICVVIPNTPVGFQLKAAAQVASQQILSEFQVPASIIDTTIEIDTVVLTGSPQTDLDRVITASTMPNISLAIVASAQEIFTATFTNQNVRLGFVHIMHSFWMVLKTVATFLFVWLSWFRKLLWWLELRGHQRVES